MITKKGVFDIVQGHQNRHLVIDPASGALFVGVGSSGNLGVEPEPKATIQRFNADGSNQTTFASGMRNPTALAFHPQTGELFALVQERDGLGDRLPSDYLTHVQQGGFYGWPFAYIGNHPQPGFANLAPDKVSATITPDLLFEAHSSVLDLVLYEGDQFPPEYKGSAFVAFKGSWNRSEPTGYKVVRVPFKDGRPEGYYENFATGFWVSGERRTAGGKQAYSNTSMCSSNGALQPRLLRPRTAVAVRPRQHSWQDDDSMHSNDDARNEADQPRSRCSV